MRKLTDRQDEVLEFIKRTIEVSGKAPSHEQITTHFGWRSRYTAVCMLDAIETKGYITRERNKHRTITVIAIDEAEANTQ